MISRRTLFRVVAQTALVAAAYHYVPDAVLDVPRYRSRMTVWLNGKRLNTVDNVVHINGEDCLKFQLPVGISKTGTAVGQCEILFGRKILCSSFTQPVNVCNGDTLIINHTVNLE